MDALAQNCFGGYDCSKQRMAFGEFGNVWLIMNSLHQSYFGKRAFCIRNHQSLDNG